MKPDRLDAAVAVRRRPRLLVRRLLVFLRRTDWAGSMFIVGTWDRSVSLLRGERMSFKDPSLALGSTLPRGDNGGERGCGTLYQHLLLETTS